MSGIRNIKNISKNYKEAEIYFHQDLDGICSYLGMKKYLEDNHIKVVNNHIIQYGSLEFNIRDVKEGRLPVLVDFAHVKDMFVIALDHHDSQAMNNNPNRSTSFKKSRSNTETISEEIASNNVFTTLDIELIKTIDSADYLKYGIIPSDVQNCVYNYNPAFSARKNRFILGLVVNRLLLVLKNKRIKVTSLDGLREHSNRNLLECLAFDCKPSLYSLYLNLQHYINNSISFEWNKDLKTYHDPKKLPTQEQIDSNLKTYIDSRKQFLNIRGMITKNPFINYDDEFKIVTQYDIGETFKTGSYDRYVVFGNFPDADWVCTIYKMGLIQISANPFKKKLNKLHLGNITKELYEKYKHEFSNFRISIGSVKRINESESYKLKQKYTDFKSVGFKYNDLITFYKDVYYLPNKKDGDFKTVEKLDLNSDIPEVKLLKKIMNKLYSEWTFEDKQEMNFYKISGLSILENMSGGHPSITNIQGMNYLDERRDAISVCFGKTVIPVYDTNGSTIYKYIQNYEDLMVFMTIEYTNILKNKLKTGQPDINTDIKLRGSIGEAIG